MVHKVFRHADVFPHEITVAPAVYTTRTTAKGVILNAHNKIVLVSKKGSGFYSLPGGGIEEGETPESALMREAQEEVGCDITILKKFATTEECRDKTMELYKTDCFLARVLLEDEGSNFVPDDSMFGLENIWISRAEAAELLYKQLIKIKLGSDNYYNRGFNSARDTFFVKTSLEINLL
ncbi:MAG: NUDIX domain-containing protein [Candidatus Vogelbacteria bacterium]|nr:NUDIX domain-containing protein [Candidatus Vogelbacteria bacterium]